MTSIRTQKAYDPDAEPLTHNESTLALKDKVSMYREVVRSGADPPFPSQAFHNISFLLFKKPRNLADGSPVYGLFKCRGAHPTEASAKLHCRKILREVDSHNQIRIAPAGVWVAITESNSVCGDLLDVDVNKTQTEEDNDKFQLRTQGIKDREEKQRGIIRQLREREEQLKNDDLYNDDESLDFYTMKRVTEMRLTENINAMAQKLKEMKTIRDRVRSTLKTMESNHSEYNESWILRYNEKRTESGISDFIPSEDFFAEYEKWEKDPESSSG